MNLFFKTILFIKYNLNYNVKLWKYTDKNPPNSAKFEIIHLNRL